MTVCDKCGKRIRGPLDISVTPDRVELQVRPTQFSAMREIDLCQECQERLVDWLKGPFESDEAHHEAEEG